ncbi:MAG: GntR family transcriptional regulator [Peptoniphilus rhinitidis]|uniref:GntR family transcriptional regulator n=1 Tax=Peptoniphilus rhinitidis TaxID=1175452 RepID=UPI002904E548|nr:GntR family transcriptional regulator [Peptoniphilus rhinitidis]MDU2110430.1 GntR family transcriptional regulator [Peptoniphilus lacydonensis]MDU3750208.1 GntR family transcriptional regulator [Peptoniphilus rhinitidis]
MEFDNNRPIYIQLLEDFKLKISSGDWKSGEKMDTVRNLAKIYGVNPNTVQRALQELEREGLAKSNRTTGRFITDDEELIEKIAKGAFYKSCDNLISVAEELNLTKEKSMTLLDEYWRGV